MLTRRRAPSLDWQRRIVYVTCCAILIATATRLGIGVASDLSLVRETLLIGQTASVIGELGIILQKACVDKGQCPQRLTDLLNERYLAAIPANPVTGSSHGWIYTVADAPRGTYCYSIVSAGTTNELAALSFQTANGTYNTSALAADKQVFLVYDARKQRPYFVEGSSPVAVAPTCPKNRTHLRPVEVGNAR